VEADTVKAGTVKGGTVKGGTVKDGTDMALLFWTVVGGGSRRGCLKRARYGYRRGLRSKRP